MATYSMRSVLIVSPFFFPERISTGKYNSIVAQALQRRGYEVTVLCSHPLYPKWKPRQAEAELPGIHTIRGGNWLRYPRYALLRRLILEAWFAWHVVRHSFRLRQRFDIILVVFPPSLCFLFGAKLLGNCLRRIGLVHDLQGTHALAAWRSLLVAPLKRAIGYVERRAFGACDKLIVLSKSMATEIVRSNYISAEKIRVCYPFSTLDCAKAQGDSLVDLFSSNRLHVVYAGALGAKQNPFALWEFIKEAAGRMRSSQFHVFSEGPNFDKLRAMATQTRMANIFFHGLVSEDQLEELYFRSTVQLLPQAKSTEAGSMPSKLPNIVASGRPIFAICDKSSELGELVERFDLGVVASTWDPEVLADRLQSFVNSELCKWNKRSDSPRRLMVAEMFSLDNLVREMLE